MNYISRLYNYVSSYFVSEKQQHDLENVVVEVPWIDKVHSFSHDIHPLLREYNAVSSVDFVAKRVIINVTRCSIPDMDVIKPKVEEIAKQHSYPVDRIIFMDNLCYV